jgi:hypothetical protein
MIDNYNNRQSYGRHIGFESFNDTILKNLNHYRMVADKDQALL